MRFKVGDKVLVVTHELATDKTIVYRSSFISTMFEYCNKIVTIKNRSYNCYRIEEDSNCHFWNDNMFVERIV